MTPYPPLPEEIERKIRRAKRLEIWTLFWLATIVGVMYLTLGSSQAMKAAWIEDLLGLVPPVLFLISARLERRPPSRKYPFGLQRAGSLAFFLSAVALAVMGGYLVYEAAHTLIVAEHPTIGTIRLFGREVWLGWVMIAALTYSVIPPVILGRMKKPLARATADKVLYTDADMNAADWKTGLAGILGIVGLSFGLWWADAAAAGLIGIDILWDGMRNVRIAVAELLDGAPRKLESAEVHPIVDEVERRLGLTQRGLTAQLRETGRFVHLVITDKDHAVLDPRAAANLAEGEGWRVIAASRALDTLPSGETRLVDVGDGPG